MNGDYFNLIQGHELPGWAADFDCESWAQFSLKYILASPTITCVLTETTNPRHMQENIEAAFGRLPDEDQRRQMRDLTASF
jgi:diketogulonate reductase-like aldo/keto reductase